MARTQLLCPVLPVVYGEQAKSSSGLDLISRVLQERRILLLLRFWGQHFPDGAGQVWQPCRIQGDAIAVLLDVCQVPRHQRAVSPSCALSATNACAASTRRLPTRWRMSVLANQKTFTSGSSFRALNASMVVEVTGRPVSYG